MNKNPDALPDFARWGHLLFVADRISNLPDHELVSGMQELMGSLDEYFPRSLHPLTDFRSYATRQFCKSISRALHQLENPPPKPSLQI